MNIWNSTDACEGVEGASTSSQHGVDSQQYTETIWCIQQSSRWATSLSPAAASASTTTSIVAKPLSCLVLDEQWRSVSTVWISRSQLADCVHAAYIRTHGKFYFCYGALWSLCSRVIVNKQKKCAFEGQQINIDLMYNSDVLNSFSWRTE